MEWLPWRVCLQGTAREAGALPWGCFVSRASARWYQLGRQEGTPMAEPGINRILHLFPDLWAEEWSNKLGYRRHGIGQPYPKPKNVQYVPR